MAATTWMTSWQDFEKITLLQLPLFLFSGTFFPVTAFHGVLRWVVEVTPLYRGVVLCRELTTGVLTWASAVSVVYLVVMGADRAGHRPAAARHPAAHLSGQPTKSCVAYVVPSVARHPETPIRWKCGFRMLARWPAECIQALTSARGVS